MKPCANDVTDKEITSFTFSSCCSSREPSWIWKQIRACTFATASPTPSWPGNGIIQNRMWPSGWLNACLYWRSSLLALQSWPHFGGQQWPPDSYIAYFVVVCLVVTHNGDRYSNTLPFCGTHTHSHSRGRRHLRYKKHALVVLIATVTFSIITTLTGLTRQTCYFWSLLGTPFIDISDDKGTWAACAFNNPNLNIWCTAAMTT